jgi:hypothetical protein
MSDDEMREEIKGKMIYVLYGFNNYACNLTHINELRDLILQDYPETKDEDIEVRFIERSRSKYARRTMLSTSIPVEDRLPEPFVSVLAYVPSEAPLPMVHESYIADEPQLWVCILERRPWKDGAVTHWMPMPEPPVE